MTELEKRLALLLIFLFAAGFSLVAILIQLDINSLDERLDTLRCDLDKFVRSQEYAEKRGWKE